MYENTVYKHSVKVGQVCEKSLIFEQICDIEGLGEEREQTHRRFNRLVRGGRW